jgi:hypothetical protein
MRRVPPKLATSSCRCGCKPQPIPTAWSSGSGVRRLPASASFPPARMPSHCTRPGHQLVPRGTWPVACAEPSLAGRSPVVAGRGRYTAWPGALRSRARRGDLNDPLQGCGSVRLAATNRQLDTRLRCAGNRASRRAGRSLRKRVHERTCRPDAGIVRCSTWNVIPVLGRGHARYRAIRQSAGARGWALAG